MSRIAFVLTNAFHQFHIRKKFEPDRRCPRTRIGLGIVNRNFHVHVTKVAAMKSLDGVICIAVWMATVVEPRLIIETFRLDDECVAFPFADRIAEPRWLHFGRKPSPIREHLPVVTLILKQDQRGTRCLYKLEWS